MKDIQRQIHPRGFTLTELLIVIAIIAALTALALMGIGRMRDMADKTSSIRILSQLQIANVSYAGDNNGTYLPNLLNDDKGSLSARWFQVPDFLNYFRGEMPEKNGKPSMEIPESALDPKVVRSRELAWNKIYSSYGQNVNGLPSATGKPNASKNYSTSSVTQPERSMAFATATDFRVAYGPRFNWFSRDPENREGKTADGGLAYRHGNKALIVFFDGHVSEFTQGDLRRIDKEQGGSKSAFWRPNQN